VEKEVLQLKCAQEICLHLLAVGGNSFEAPYEVDLSKSTIPLFDLQMSSEKHPNTNIRSHTAYLLTQNIDD
jgi:hypothetical protein